MISLLVSAAFNLEFSSDFLQINNYYFGRFNFNETHNNHLFHWPNIHSLGLPNKKDTVTDLLRQNNINICCPQETEVSLNFPEKVLNVGGYNLELETNTVKKRAGIYLKNDVNYGAVNYIRRSDLEKPDFHIVIVDIMSNVSFDKLTIFLNVI